MNFPHYELPYREHVFITLKSCVCDIWPFFLNLKIPAKIKIRTSAFPEIEQRVAEFFDQAEAEGRQLSSKIVRQKALEIAEELGITNFNASKGIEDICSYHYLIK